MTTIASKPTTYAAAYATLAAIAERLKANGNAASIDTLAQDVATAKIAYASCQARLAAIRAEIDAELASDSGSARTRSCDGPTANRRRSGPNTHNSGASGFAGSVRRPTDRTISE